MNPTLVFRRIARSAQRSGGDTLIEVMVAVLLLALLAVAGGAHLYHARANAAMQRNRLIALELTNSRLEQIRTCRPVVFESLSPGPHALYRSGGTWTISSNHTDEIITLNHRDFPIQSSVEWVETNSYLRVTVTTAYRPEQGDAVSLTTLYAP